MKTLYYDTINYKNLSGSKLKRRLKYLRLLIFISRKNNYKTPKKVTAELEYLKERLKEEKEEGDYYAC